MKKSRESVSIEVHLANSLLENMNHKLLWVAPEKRETVQTVMFAMAFEIFAAFNIVPSFELVNLTEDKKLKSFKLFGSNIPWPKRQTTPEYLNERIIAAALEKEILLLLLEDPDTLVPIVADLTNIIEKFLKLEHKRILNYVTEDKSPILEIIFSDEYLYPKKHKSKIFHHNQMPYNHDNYKIMDNSHFFMAQKRKQIFPAYENQNQILHEFFHQQHIDFNHLNENPIDHMVRLLRRNLTTVRFLLVLVDKDGNRFMPLTQLNLVTVCSAIATHEADLQINTDRLERLYYLCSQSKKFSSQVTNWMRMYVQHCAANDTPISFPELLLTYCVNFPEHVDERGPLALQTLCAKLLRNRPRHQIPFVTALELIDEESVLPNGIGDDRFVVELLTNLVNPPAQRQHLQLGM